MKKHHKHHKHKNFTSCGRYGLKKSENALDTTCILCQGTHKTKRDINIYIQKNKRNLYKLRQRDFIRDHLYQTMDLYVTPLDFKSGKILLKNIALENGYIVVDHVWADFPSEKIVSKLKEKTGRRVKIRAFLKSYKHRKIIKYTIKIVSIK